MVTSTSPCSNCSIGKRHCLWTPLSRPPASASSGVPTRCLRCIRLDKKCDGPQLRPLQTRKLAVAKLNLTGLNLARSCALNTLGEQHLSHALSWELVRAYKEHLANSKDLDADFAIHREQVLGYSGRDAVSGTMEELRLLVYMSAGARLSSHSALVGSTSPCGLDVATRTKLTPEYLDMGFARQGVLQYLTARMLPKIAELVKDITIENAQESLSLLWLAVVNFSPVQDVSERHIFMKRLVERFVAFTALLKPTQREIIYAGVDVIQNRHPAVSFYGFLGQSEETQAGTVVPVAFFDNWVSTTSPSTAFDLLPPNDLFVLSNTLHHSTEAESILVALRSRMGAHHQYLIKLLFYDQTPFSLRCQLYWEKLMDAEHFFRDQTSQIKSISGDSNPPGPTRFLRSLFTLRSTHVLHAWGALRETKQIITNAESCRVQTYVVLSSWIAHAILLMNNTQDETMWIDVVTRTSQILFFLRGSEFLNWARECPSDSVRLLNVLTYGSYFLAEARQVALDLQGVFEGSTSPDFPSLDSGTPKSPLDHAKGVETSEEISQKIVMEALRCVELDNGG